MCREARGAQAAGPVGINHGFSSKGATVDYLDFYHFLEGLSDYDNWLSRIDMNSKHRRLIPVKGIWNNSQQILGAFDKLFTKFQNSILVVSYRSEGIPSIESLEKLMAEYKNKVSEVGKVGHRYVLSTKDNHEILLIGQ